MLYHVNTERLWSSLNEMATVGATAGGGVCRLALTEADRAGRDLFLRWCRDAGLTVRVDGIGNLFARTQAAQPEHPAVLVGSHLDSQPSGGRFDGAYGVLAALEVVRSLNDLGIIPRKPVEIVSWTNEEGARFAPAMLGSAVFTGEMALEQAWAITGCDGVRVQDALDAIGYRGQADLRNAPVDSYLEAHIEQGPVLENSGVPIGIVTGGQGIRWFDVRACGRGAHAGTTPMEFRRDALFAAAEMIREMEQAACRFAPLGLITVGQISVPNSSRNTIPGQVLFTVDLRHPEDAVLDAMEAALRDTLGGVAERRGVEAEILPVWSSPFTPFDGERIAAIENAAIALGYPSRRISSGAGHDAINMAHHYPTAMVFIPCANGVSHNEAESISCEHAAHGADVLLNAVLALAGKV